MNTSAPSPRPPPTHCRKVTAPATVAASTDRAPPALSDRDLPSAPDNLKTPDAPENTAVPAPLGEGPGPEVNLNVPNPKSQVGTLSSLLLALCLVPNVDLGVWTNSAGNASKTIATVKQRVRVR
jgi:hypothetical protein